MSHYIGIDLGTTNSAICSYNGEETKIWKSPEQNDVTPSAIYIDRRGNKYVGKRAYDSAPHSPDNSALLFKRLMGTSTPIELPAVQQTKSPEECSAEILKVLFGYLPEEVRNDPCTGTVITVPAAFNQMQKDATKQAAEMAGLGNVALMQEPVAAVMSVMRSVGSDGMFLIFDLGGGTLDIAIAESMGGRVNLLAHGGIAMCGGRDFDRALVDSVVKPWLLEQFNLPDDLSVNPDYKSLMRLANWATERAKIELSANEEAVISLSETEARAKDANDEEIYIDIQINRSQYDELISERVNEAINSARETLKKAGLSPHDLERIVFVGGPTNYKPLRDKVAFELGIPGTTDVNPMTAVAEGASVFAESIDWGTDNRSRKSSRGQISAGGNLDVSFNYIARTPESKAKIAAQVKGNVDSGVEFQVDSIDTGWTSGRLALSHGVIVELALPKFGDNVFKVFVFDANGGPIALSDDRIVITRTAATIDAIPASHSIGIEVLHKLGGHPVLEPIVKSGDALPHKTTQKFKTTESLKAGSTGSINFKIWEGDIQDPISDNRPIGVLKVTGSDFDDGVIPAGSELICEIEVHDSGQVEIEVSIPAIGGVFNSGKSFYSRTEGQLDFSSDTKFVTDEGEKTQARIQEITEVVDDPKLDQALKKVESAVDLNENETETEKSQEAMEQVLEAKKLLAEVRRDHLKEIRKLDLAHVVSFFNEFNRELARPSEVSSFDNLVKTAEGSLDRNDRDFEHHLDELKQKNFEILWRQDWFIVERFKSMVESPHLFADKNRFEELASIGIESLKADEIEKLRAVVGQLSMIQIGGSSEDSMFDVANIVRS